MKISVFGSGSGGLVQAAVMAAAPYRRAGTLLESLWAAGANVRAFDPEAMQQAQLFYPHESKLMLMGTPESVLPGADASVICTEWQPFKARYPSSPTRLKPLPQNKCTQTALI